MARKTAKEADRDGSAEAARSKHAEAAQKLAAAARQSITKPEPEGPASDANAVKRLRQAREAILGELRKTIVGMDEAIDLALVAVLARGHVLLEGLPGTGKSLLAASIAKTLSLSFERVSWTDGPRCRDFARGERASDALVSGRSLSGWGPPNLLLACDLEHSSPVARAALLEAMQASSAHTGSDDLRPEKPFVVFATQTPPAPGESDALGETQLDRFLFKVCLEYPSLTEEIDMMRSVAARRAAKIAEVLSRREVLTLQDLVDRVPVTDHVLHYVATLVRATRPEEQSAPRFIADLVSRGCGPRACLDLAAGAKARAILHGRFHASIDDARTLAPAVIRHRLTLNPAASAEGADADHIVARLLEEIPSGEALHEGSHHKSASR